MKKKGFNLLLCTCACVQSNISLNVSLHDKKTALSYCLLHVSACLLYCSILFHSLFCFSSLFHSLFYHSVLFLNVLTVQGHGFGKSRANWSTAERGGNENTCGRLQRRIPLWSHGGGIRMGTWHGKQFKEDGVCLRVEKVEDEWASLKCLLHKMMYMCKYHLFFLLSFILLFFKIINNNILYFMHFLLSTFSSRHLLSCVYIYYHVVKRCLYSACSLLLKSQL